LIRERRFPAADGGSQSGVTPRARAGPVAFDVLRRLRRDVVRLRQRLLRQAGLARPAQRHVRQKERLLRAVLHPGPLLHADPGAVLHARAGPDAVLRPDVGLL
jgi:hypothetical protein